MKLQLEATILFLYAIGLRGSLYTPSKELPNALSLYGYSWLPQQQSNQWIILQHAFGLPIFYNYRNVSCSLKIKTQNVNADELLLIRLNRLQRKIPVMKKQQNNIMAGGHHNMKNCIKELQD